MNIKFALAEPVPLQRPRISTVDALYAYELVDVSLIHDDGRIALDRVSLNIRRGSNVRTPFEPV